MIWLSLVLVSTLFAQNDPSSNAVARGKDLFARTCVSGPCHGTAGEVGRAPKLKGRTFDENFLQRIVHEGVPKTTMHAWKDRLPEGAIRDIIAYISTLGQAPVAVASATQADFSGPPQAKRGHAIFFEAPAGTACATCHAIGGRGTAIGPDLTRWARMAPRAIVMAIRATRTEYTQAVKLKKGVTFPGMRVAQDENTAQYYDLSVTPPTLRKLDRAEIESTTDNVTWQHPPSSAGYTSEQLADIIAYIRWSSYSDTKGVKPEDIE